MTICKDSKLCVLSTDCSYAFNMILKVKRPYSSPDSSRRLIFCDYDVVFSVGYELSYDAVLRLSSCFTRVTIFLHYRNM